MNMSLNVDPALATPGDMEAAGVALVATALNAVLADSFELHLETRNFHWHVSGPHFRDHDLPLDEQATQIFDATDAITRHQAIADDGAPCMAPRTMLAELRDDNLALVDAIRGAQALADEARDNATPGMIGDRSDRRAWFLFEVTRQ